MKLQTTTSHTISFTVEAFWNEEGGMGQDQYGEAVDTLQQAVRLLELARVKDPKTNWVIVCDVKTTVS